MHPIPGQSLPEGWVYITHPDVGDAEHPVKRTALAVWEKAGWTEVSATKAEKKASTKATKEA